jgi:uncharacterized membrane protein
MHWFWLAWFRLKERWRTSLWMIPGCFVIGAILLANLVVEIEQELWVDGTAFPDRSTTVSILTAMFGGLLTFSGFIITMLLLVPPFVSAQLSPRVLQLWLRQPYLKIALGLLFGATTFAFTVLNEISDTYVPSVATGAAAVLTFGAILIFLAVLSSFVHSLRPATMSDYLSKVGTRAVLSTYPRTFAPGDDTCEKADHTANLPEEPLLRVINTGPGRVVQAINERALVAKARRLDAVLVFPYAIGEFVHTGAPLIEVYNARRTIHANILRLSILLGEERTILQDPALVIRILVDIAIKGLSPAINDPTTTTQVLHRIEELLVILSTRDLTANDLYDRAGTLRVVLPTWTWGDYVRLATREIRLYGGDSWQTTRRLRGMLEDLLAYVPEERRGVLEEELALLDWTLDQQRLSPADRDFAETPDREGIGVRGARPAIDWRDMVPTIEARSRRSWPLRRH